MTINILGVSSSLRVGSDGLRAVGLVLESARRAGATTKLLDLRVTQLPLYQAHAGSDVEAVRAAKELTTWADAFVLATPDYHGSMSGAMKNYLDHHWSEFAGKVFGYLCTSHEKGLTAMDQMRTAVRQCYGWSLPYGVAIHGKQDFAEGRVTNPQLGKKLEMTGRDLAVYGSLIRGQFAKDVSGGVEETFAAKYRTK